MDFTKFDVVILVLMSLSVILMSFTYPALGLAGGTNETAEDDIPTFNMSADRFDLVGDFPDDPRTPSTGELVYNEVEDTENQIWLEGDTNKGGAELLARTPAEIEGDEPSVDLNLWNDSGGVYAEDRVNRTTPGTETLIAGDWKIDIDFREIDGNSTTGQWNFSADYEVEERPSSGGGFISSIPLVGGLYDTGSELAGIVGWIGAIFYWFFGTIWEITLNLIGVLYDVVIFIVGLAVWQITTYFDVVSNAPGYAAVFLVVPGVILFAEFAKLIMLAIKLLPTT